ncbi:hypothetical protein JXQ31_08885 [candidate division KSB1 bacterium]|nr:hypothetical protein [candidate division KSB1 bacterium]
MSRIFWFWNMELKINRTFLTLLLVVCLSLNVLSIAQPGGRSPEYEQVQQSLASGWNTWNMHSVLSHVLLPEGLTINLSFEENTGTSDKYLRYALIGTNQENGCSIKPGPHTGDGSYTELQLSWRTVNVRVQSATTEEGDLVLLITPLNTAQNPPVLVAETGIIRDRSGHVEYDNNSIKAVFSDTTINIFYAGEPFQNPNIPVISPFLAMTINSPVGISTGKRRTTGEISVIIERQRQTYEMRVSGYGDLADVYAAMQTVMGWNTIYDPQNNRVLTSVSRTRTGEGGALFRWDTFFAAYLAALDNRNLAYANVREIMNEITEKGFIPNMSRGNGRASMDRSLPPIGSITVWDIYRKYQEKWFLQELFEDLFAWNRWWDIYRNYDGLLCWGSNPYEDTRNETVQGTTQAAAMESGLDNSPMYENIPYNDTLQMMELWDVGLNSLYIADCNALAEIAKVLERDSEAKELLNRASKYTKNMERLWDKESGLYLNVRTDSLIADKRLSPTHFYPFLAKVPSEKQAQTMIDDHLYNKDEFWGDWVLPSIPRNDSTSAGKDNLRGPILAPLNFLVYLGLRNYDLPQVRKDLSEKAKQLLLKEWQANGYVCENYNAVTGECTDTIDNDRYYTWGGLLGLIVMIEDGYFDRMGK